VFDLFREVNMKGTTVLVATHDWETVRKMQRRIITMERGRVTDDGKRHMQWSLSLRPPVDEGPDGPTARRGEP
jgi:energy-coupling factor transporter ATP-binding protein EcfA2